MNFNNNYSGDPHDGGNDDSRNDAGCVGDGDHDAGHDGDSDDIDGNDANDNDSHAGDDAADDF
eukprot:1173382-Amphidinium_carterae.1